MTKGAVIASKPWNFTESVLLGKCFFSLRAQLSCLKHTLVSNIFLEINPLAD